MKLSYLLLAVTLILCFDACTPNNKKSGMSKTENINEELTKINGLLQDSSFALVVAGSQDANYYVSQGQKVPAFFEGSDSILKKSFKEEKIAINLAGFYALECGIGALIEQNGKTPVYWLQQIADKTLDSNNAMLLNRFANATWKASQPFRDLKRLTKDNFISANFLSAEEIQKDADQITAAASFLLDSLNTVSNAPIDAQFEKINQLLKDKQYALQMASHMEAAYYKGQNQPVPEFLSPAEETAVIEKSAKEEKMAINLAGFYAVECGVSYLSSVQNKLPSDILKSIVNDSIGEKDKELLERFANATWKAGQPFRSLDRVTRNIFMPFDLLPKDEVKKDWDQIKSAAAIVQKAL
jgi:hypothetical protein